MCPVGFGMIFQFFCVLCCSVQAISQCSREAVFPGLTCCAVHACDRVTMFIGLLSNHRPIVEVEPLSPLPDLSLRLL